MISTKKPYTYSNYDVDWVGCYDVTTKSLNPKFPIITNRNCKTCRIFRGFEQLSSSRG